MTASRGETGALIRKMSSEDLSAVRAIDKSVSVVPWPETSFRHATDYGYQSWVALSQNAVVGFCISRQVIDELSILNIGVQQHAQNQGIGRQLMMHALANATANGAVDAFLEVRQSNRAAQHLYTSLGFNTVGIRENYYPAAQAGQWENAVLMACALNTGQTSQELE